MYTRATFVHPYTPCPVLGIAERVEIWNFFLKISRRSCADLPGAGGGFPGLGCWNPVPFRKSNDDKGSSEVTEGNNTRVGRKCAPFCAHPRSKWVALGSTPEGDKT